MRAVKIEDDLGPLAEKAWENILGILDNIALKEKMNLPAEWVWVWFKVKEGHYRRVCLPTSVSGPMEGSPQPRETRQRAMERVEGGRSATEPVCFVDGAGEVGAGRIDVHSSFVRLLRTHWPF